MTKKAVLIGCNYEGTEAELKGCINDVRRMYQCLVDRYEFSEDDITVMIDIDDSYIQPTGKNIRRVLEKLIRSAEPGDYLFVHYSGHGTRLPAESGEMDDTGYDECIVPTDMNLITDDDFNELVCQVPDGCRLTIVSDSCHSGGLIDGAVEQIGESTSANKDQHHSPVHSITDFLKQTVKDAIREKLETRGLHVPSTLRHGKKTEVLDYAVVEDGHEDREYVKSRSLPLSTLVEILQQKTGKNDIDVGKLRPSLYQIFGEDASPKVKKFMKFIFQKLQHRRHGEHEDPKSEGEEGGYMKIIGNLALEFLKQSLEDNDEAYAEPAMQTQFGSKAEIYAGTKRALPRNGILLSGCQSDQTSVDAIPQCNTDAAYGAFSNSIQVILAGSNYSITNKELVLKARKTLKRQGFTQRPGLYCSNHNTDAPFIC